MLSTAAARLPSIMTHVNVLLIELSLVNGAYRPVAVLSQNVIVHRQLLEKMHVTRVSIRKMLTKPRW